MNGSTIGNLTAYLLVGGTETFLWTMKGNQGNKWKSAQTEVPAGVDFQIKFVAVAGSSYLGDIGLDNLFITSCRKF